MNGIPETPEGVALALMRDILEREADEDCPRPDQRNRRTRDEIFDLYAECFRAASGDRARPDLGQLH